MTCQIKDVLIALNADGTGHGVPRAYVQAVPTIVPFSLKQGSAYNFCQNPEPVCETDSNGNWQLILPWPSESNPSNEQWQLLFPDGTVYQGTVPDLIAGPLSLWQLRNSYGWTSVATATALSVPVQAATTSGLGDVLIDYPPSSGYPVALTIAGIQKQGIPATANNGLFSIGPGPYDGSSPGHFSGVAGAAGTVLAMNAPAGFAGELLDFQVNGSSILHADYVGNVIATGSFQGYQYLGYHFRCVGGTPTVSNMVAGISGTPTVNGTDHGGTITFTTTASPPGGSTQLFQVNYWLAFANAPAVLMGLNSGQPAGGGFFYSANLSASSFGVAATGALAANTTYTVTYIVMR